MKTHLDCIPCFFRQALQAARAATDEEGLHKKVMDRLGVAIRGISLESSPPEIAEVVYATVREITEVEDPYAAEKEHATRRALEIYSLLRERVEAAEDPLLDAIVLATAGNAIDLGALRSADLDTAINDAQVGRFAILDYESFQRCLSETDSVLYIGDNAGESVLDRLLIEQLGKPVTYVVRQGPIINDVTYEDAVNAGLDKIATVVSSGCRASGLVPKLCDPECRKKLRRSNLVISKGQGNYEGLSAEAGRIFFLLKAKCQLVAEDLGVNEGALVLKGINVQTSEREARTPKGEKSAREYR